VKKIPHDDKVFSLFEDYTEWLSKGKAGVPFELGLNVCIMEANTGFILHHKVMQQCTDSEIAVDIVRETKAQFPKLASCSFDKGFHSQSNQTALAE
jgi:IS5 family transposase